MDLKSPDRKVLTDLVGALAFDPSVNVRLTAGYGDATARAVMDDEGRRAQVRYEVLGKLLTALRDGSR